jgi:hypothetical protein
LGERSLCRPELPLPELGRLCRLWRVRHDLLAGAGCGELVDTALHPIALTVALRRGHLLVIGRLRLQTGHAHAENRLGMAAVDELEHLQVERRVLMAGEADESCLPLFLSLIEALQHAPLGICQFRVVVVDDPMNLPEIEMIGPEPQVTLRASAGPVARCAHEYRPWSLRRSCLDGP